jgi:DNA-binding YbaB/EbfC family protein
MAFKGGFSGGFGGQNLQNLMKQAQKMQEEMEKAKQEISESEFTGVSGGGMVEVVISGEKRVKSINLKPEVVDPDDVEMLEDLIVAAFNHALEQIEQLEKDKLPNIPGM